eukprot:COSAG01_NODE_23_length_37704_cov_30.005877_41_plen_59_part_00
MMTQGEQAFTLFSPVDEDCLYANIWMPAAPPAPPMPVGSSEYFVIRTKTVTKIPLHFC